MFNNYKTKFSFCFFSDSLHNDHDSPMPKVYRLLRALVLLTFFLVSCGAPTQSGSQVTNEQTTPVETSVPIAITAPSDTPTPAPTATFSGPWLTPLNNDVDCRFGPTPDYEQVGTLVLGSAAEISGLSEDGGWFQTANPEDGSETCWFNGDLVAKNGDLSQLAVIPAPVGQVTRIAISFPRDFILYSDYTMGNWPDGFTCDKSVSYVFFPEIWLNGPATVTYHWEIHGGIEVIGDEIAVTLTRAGNFYDLSEGFSDQQVEGLIVDIAQCGDYSVSFVVTSPNPIKLEGDFRIPIECPDNCLVFD